MTTTKHEWRKQEKDIYLPKAMPVVIDVPEFKYISIAGQCNPNSEEFAEYIGALYPIAYAIKMNYKKMAKPPKGYTDYTVYPLTGIWDITDEAKKTYDGTLNKDDLVFNLMLRQPDFVTEEYFQEMLELAHNKKPNPLFEQVQFERITDGKCVQMMHVGPYDDEPASFAAMEQFAEEQGLTRASKIHREIYISDFRKVAPEKLKTVLRFQVITAN